MTDTSSIAAIILAAGRGTRMKSDFHKPLHRVANKPMVRHIVDNLAKVDVDEVIVVKAPDDQYIDDIVAPYPTVVQSDQKGTGDAALIGVNALNGMHDTVIIAYGDMPLFSVETIQKVIHAPYDITLVAMRPDNPRKYGRVIFDKLGNLKSVVEYKDATDEERAIKLCNAGNIVIKGNRAKDLLDSLDNNNAANEYYLTRIIDIAYDRGLKCGVIEAPADECAGANTRSELAALESIFQSKLRDRAMDNGATLIDPDTVYFSADTVIGRDVIVEPNVFFGPGVTVADGVHIKAFSHIEGATIGKKAIIGPMARLRPGTEIGEKVKVGNFVEVKKSTVGMGTKINHLSYIGDTTIGHGSNIGAGVVICNYDGYNKYQTTIGNSVNVGANNSIIAPITIGNHTITAAGSTITDDVPSGDLAIARARQTNKMGWAQKFRDTMEKLKKKGKAA